MYATKRRRRNVKNYKHPPKESQKSNPSKRHRERLNAELENLSSLLPFEPNVLSKLDKLSILRLAVSYLRIKSYFQANLKSSLSYQQSQNECLRSRLSHVHYLDPNFSEGNAILESLNGFVLIINTNSEVFYASRTVEQYIGFHQSDIIHQSVFELIHSEDRDEFKKQLAWNSKLPADKANLKLSEILSNREYSKYLERNFTVRFRCLLDNTSGFLTLDIVGRLSVLDGQRGSFQNGDHPPKSFTKGKNSKAAAAAAAAAASASLNAPLGAGGAADYSSMDREPSLALFAIACPFGPPSLFELPQRDSLFKTKHKITLAPISIDAKGKSLLGYNDNEFVQFGGYDLVHPDDLKYYANAHKELLKTGSSGLICYRLQTSGQAWQWLQSSMRIIYKSNKPECVMANHRPLTNEEGEELYYKRGFDFKLPYPCLYDFETNFGGILNGLSENTPPYGAQHQQQGATGGAVSFKKELALPVASQPAPLGASVKGGTAPTPAKMAKTASGAAPGRPSKAMTAAGHGLKSEHGTKTKSSKLNKAQLIQQRAAQQQQHQQHGHHGHHGQPVFAAQHQQPTQQQQQHQHQQNIQLHLYNSGKEAAHLVQTPHQNLHQSYKFQLNYNGQALPSLASHRIDYYGGGGGYKQEFESPAASSIYETAKLGGILSTNLSSLNTSSSHDYSSSSTGSSSSASSSSSSASSSNSSSASASSSISSVSSSSSSSASSNSSQSSLSSLTAPIETIAVNLSSAAAAGYQHHYGSYLNGAAAYAGYPSSLNEHSKYYSSQYSNVLLYPSAHGGGSGGGFSNGYQGSGFHQDAAPPLIQTSCNGGGGGSYSASSSGANSMTSGVIWPDSIDSTGSQQGKMSSAAELQSHASILNFQGHLSSHLHGGPVDDESPSSHQHQHQLHAHHQAVAAAAAAGEGGLVGQPGGVEYAVAAGGGLVPASYTDLLNCANSAAAMAAAAKYSCAAAASTYYNPYTNFPSADDYGSHQQIQL